MAEETRERKKRAEEEINTMYLVSSYFMVLLFSKNIILTPF